MRARGTSPVITYQYYGLSSTKKPVVAYLREVFLFFPSLPLLSSSLFSLCSLTSSPSSLFFTAQIHPSITWDDILPYTISSHHTRPSSCAVCNSKLPTQQLCVKVESIFQFQNKGHQVVHLSFCLREECLNKIPQHRRANRLHTYPAFHNVLAVDDNIANGVRRNNWTINIIPNNNNTIQQCKSNSCWPKFLFQKFETQLQASQFEEFKTTTENRIALRRALHSNHTSTTQ